MKVQVLGVRQTGKGFSIAHVQCGNLFGDCIATEEVTGPGEYDLKTSLAVVNGRLTPCIRVEPLK